MTCGTCNHVFNYCFYINDEHWRKAVGEEWQERICAHCVLEKLGGSDWYIIHNEPAEKMNRVQREADAES